MTLFAVIMNSYACAGSAFRERFTGIKKKNVSRRAFGRATGRKWPADINNIVAKISQ
jgi:hypothetical protein